MANNKNRRGSTSAHRKVKTSARNTRKDTSYSVKIAKSTSRVLVSEEMMTENADPDLIDKKPVIITPSQETPKVEKNEKTEPVENLRIESVLDNVLSAEAEDRYEENALKTLADEKMRERAEIERKIQEPVIQKTSAKELKDREIKKAVAAAERSVKKKPTKNAHTFKLGWGTTLAAVSAAAAIVFAVVYFVNLSTPDLSLRVAAIQTGIDASYPSYVPRDFSLSDVTSESGKITMNFKNSSTGETFALIEEESSWDTTALLENFVRKEYSASFSTVKENGLTLYIDGSSAAWVNAGKIFKIRAENGVLTKKQISSIAASV